MAGSYQQPRRQVLQRMGQVLHAHQRSGIECMHHPAWPQKGSQGQRAHGLGVMPRLSRLYWYTVEFGLVRAADGLRIYGAGIVSSRTESIFALDDASPNRLGFDLRRVMRTHYRIDDFQQTYFVIDSFEDLLEQTLHTDFGPLYAELAGTPDLPPPTVLPTDRVDWRGTQRHG